MFFSFESAFIEGIEKRNVLDSVVNNYDILDFYNHYGNPSAVYNYLSYLNPIKFSSYAIVDYFIKKTYSEYHDDFLNFDINKLSVNSNFALKDYEEFKEWDNLQYIIKKYYEVYTFIKDNSALILFDFCNNNKKQIGFYEHEKIQYLYNLTFANQTNNITEINNNEEKNINNIDGQQQDNNDKTNIELTKDEDNNINDINTTENININDITN